MITFKEKKQPLYEKLELATKQQFDLLQKQIDKDSELKRMLTTPMKDIPQYYWLYSDAIDQAKESSLLQILEYFVIENRSTLLFSKTSGGLFTGFILYSDTGIEIKGIKTASFFDDNKKPNQQLAVDLINNFIDKYISTRKKIEWSSDKKNNYANDQYIRFLDKKKYIWNRYDNPYNNKLWIYSVSGIK